MIEDGSDADLAGLDSVDFEDGDGRGLARARLRRRAPPTTATSSTPAAPPACPRAWCGATRTSSSRSAAASTRSRTSASTDESEELVEKALAGGRPVDDAADRAAHARRDAVGRDERRFAGNKIVLVAKFDAGRGRGELVEQEKVNTMMITGDAMARPLIEALDDPDDELRPVVAVRPRRAPRRCSRRRVKDQLLRALPEPDHHRRDRLVGERLQRLLDGREGQHRDEGRPDRDGRSADTVRARRGPRRRSSPAPASSARSPASGNIPLEYYKDPEKTAETFVTARRRHAATSIPGDFATVEADGTHHAARPRLGVDQLGGEKIYPEEVEGAVKSHPDVFDGVVVGVPDERWGERSPRSCSPADDRRIDIELAR